MLITHTKTESIAHLGEVALIKQIKSWLGPVNPDTPAGMGDDCAILNRTDERQLITTDAVSYGQHFDDSVSPEDAGAKLIKRNLSDIAAMGGIPGPAVLALLCGPDVSTRWIERFFKGIRQTCVDYNISLVGGDVSSLPPGNFSAVITLTGQVQVPILRSTAQLGDYIYVTGSLGGSILGKHFQFEPRLAEGQWLAQNTSCSSMMDLTDGLAKDLPALLPEATHAELNLERLPIATAAHTLAKTSGNSALEHACCDGEDYELIFTLNSKADCNTFETQWADNFPKTELHRIGTIRHSSKLGPLIDAKTNTALPWSSGFEHLKYS
jgi:thiamine-monophosphate kinase